MFLVALLHSARFDAQFDGAPWRLAAVRSGFRGALGRAGLEVLFWFGIVVSWEQIERCGIEANPSKPIDPMSPVPHRMLVAFALGSDQSARDRGRSG